jgi:toxin FitB
MSYLLDTCVISECVKKSPVPAVVAWMNQQQEGSLYLSILTVAEIKKGIYKIKISQPQKAVLLQNWLNKLELEFDQRVLSINTEILDRWASLSVSAETQGNKLAVMDSLIAATAHFHNLTLATRNVDDFKHCGLNIFNPFSNTLTK